MDKTTLGDDGTSFNLGDLHFESLAYGGMFQLRQAGGDDFQELSSVLSGGKVLTFSY
jgi:hypothetical protein